MFESRQGLGSFLFATVSRLALVPTQPSIQWIPGALSLGVKLPRRETDRSLPSSAEVKNAWSYTSTPNMPSWFMEWCSVTVYGKLYNEHTETRIWLRSEFPYFLKTTEFRSNSTLNLYNITIKQRQCYYITIKQHPQKEEEGISSYNCMI
jgi:hypothetical protein